MVNRRFIRQIVKAERKETEQDLLLQDELTSDGEFVRLINEPEIDSNGTLVGFYKLKN